MRVRKSLWVYTVDNTYILCTQNSLIQIRLRMRGRIRIDEFCNGGKVLLLFVATHAVKFKNKIECLISVRSQEVGSMSKRACEVKTA